MAMPALPPGWEGFNAQQKIDWFNQNAVAPEQLLTAGVSQGDIDWMKTQGYTGGATTAAPAVRSGLSSLQDKVAEYERLYNAGMSDADIRKSAEQVYGTQSDADWDYLRKQALPISTMPVDPGKYTDPGPTAQQQAPKAVRTGLTTAQQKADEYKRLRGLGMSDAEIRSAVTPVYGTQSDADWTALRGLAGFGSTATGGNTATANTTTIDPSQSTLSPNFSSYVYDMLAKGQAAAELPFQPFTGERFAPASELQRQAFETAKNLTTPEQYGQASDIFRNIADKAKGLSYTPTQFDTGLGALKSVQDYMNPYTSAVTDIEAREARRQADIGRQSEQARLAQAGAYGGSRQAIMEAERQRNLGTQIGDITSKGLQGAYDRAMQQRLAESKLGLEAQGLGEQSKQFGAKYGLEGLSAQQGAAQGLAGVGSAQGALGLQQLGQQLGAGLMQRQIAQEPLDFGYQQFQESVKFPYQQATYMHSLLGGLPIQAAPYQANPGQSGMFSGLQGALAGLALYNAFNPK